MIFNWKKYPKQEKLNSRDSIIISKPDGSTKNLPVSAIKFKFQQASASATWVVGHRLNGKPSVTLTDLSGNKVEANIVYNSDSQITITFSSATTGYAYLN
jgi:hypothetical protein|tara:strand:+ start:550 stop:849 length:300 start_codon:yes stop_codon:yes gene_type:complete